VLNQWLDIPLEKMTYEWLVKLITVLETSTGITESPWVEVKSQRNGQNVAEAVMALANADGGLVLVGISDDKAKQGHTAIDRIVGIPKRDYEALPLSLSASLRDGMPEIQPIAVPGSENIVLVLRVDADAFTHPVVVAGKVKIRVESSSINADRLTIERLVARDKGGPGAGMGLVTPFNSENMPFWESGYEPYATIRIAGSLELTRQVLERPWLPSASVTATRRGVEHLVIPDAVWMMGALFQRVLDEARPWHLDWRRERDIRLTIQPKDENRWPLGALGAGVHLALSGQTLYVLVASWLSPSEKSEPLSLVDLHHLLCGLLVSSRDLLYRVADSLKPATAKRWNSWKGWLQPTNNSTVIDTVVDLTRWERASTMGGGGYLLPEYTVPDVSGSSFDALVREWILLFLAANGCLDHEEDVALLNSPAWLK
jgi:hypothetical protein